jgi:membrane protease YdiL (CAAX protease family)
MEANKISLKTFSASLGSVLLIEALLRQIPAGGFLNPLATLGLGRCLEAVALVSITVLLEKDPGAIGLLPSRMPAGFRKGLIWSMGFGIMVGIVYLVLLAAGINALNLFGRPPQSFRQQLYTFFLVGGVIAPVAEEIFFRGIIYGYFRKWGISIAVVTSSLIFVFFHFTGPYLPATQMVGGILFAVAYEKEQNLMVPITIHCLGNLAIFSLMLFK